MLYLKRSLLVLLGIALFGAGHLHAVTADPAAVIEVTQPDGNTTLTLRPMGDERTGRLVTTDGYTVVRGDDGWYRYAELDAEGRLQASTVRATNLDARSIAEAEYLGAIPADLKPVQERMVPVYPEVSVEETQMLTQRTAQTTNELLMILIQFPDYPAVYPPSDFEDLMHEPGFDYYGSMNDFFDEASFGEFNVHGTATIWYTAAYNHDYYGYGSGNNWVAAARLVKEACEAADPDVDFSQYDYDGNGTVDGIFIVHAGPGAESGYSDFPWSHAWSLTGAGLSAFHADGVTVNRYSMEPEKANSSARVKIGVFCHEYGHVLGLPDLYDTDYSSNGVGDWCMMSGGSWNGPWGYGGACPAQFSAWCKAQLGFITPTNVTEELTDLIIPDAVNNPVAYRLWYLGEMTNEYFLVEYRQQVGFDQYLPGCGLAIWHVDEDMPSNEWDAHRLVDLEERDRSENNSSGDVWLNASFGHYTLPNSNSYTGDSSGVTVDIISTSCETGGLLVNLSSGDDLCAVDSDGDGFADCVDNCLATYNPDQADWNEDGTGDVCGDADSDGLLDVTDNCPGAHNPGQEDQDGNGIGDACCCGYYNSGFTGNANCSVDGKVTLSDITLMIDHVFISKAPLCCQKNANTNRSSDGLCTLSDISRAIDAVFISKSLAEICL